MLTSYLEANAEGRLLNTRALGRVSGTDASFKYYGGTAYRPDIVPGRVVLEVRDAHKNVPSLVDRLMRTTFFLQFGRAQFAAASELRAFNPAADFNKLPKKVQTLLKDLFPPRYVPGETYTQTELRSLEVYRNFGYPLRDWSAQLGFLQQSRSMTAEVASAQAAYVAKLGAVADDLAAGRITERVAKARIQGALAQFAPESGLPNAYRRWVDRNLSRDAAWGRYLNVATRELGPLRQAFPATIWEGSLETRLQRLMARWPNQISVVNDVSFSFTADAAGATPVHSPRRVLLVSTKGLSSEQITALTRDYTDAFARGTVSFPLGERAGHLYTRLGNQTYDYYGWFNENPYKAPSQTRLEAFVNLSPEEELLLSSLVDCSSSV
jgi:hypothetical protein